MTKNTIKTGTYRNEFVEEFEEYDEEQLGDQRGEGNNSLRFHSFDNIEGGRLKARHLMRPAELSNSTSSSQTRIGTSLIYTPPSISSIQRESSGQENPFATNFGSIFPSKLLKPVKIRRMATSKKKPCNCTKSMCLKLYCECFASGEFCLDCNCRDCHNNLEHEAERSRAIKASLDRNPGAFKPKIGVAAKASGKAVDMERLHQRGCHCKKSNCLKNYCECYEAKVPCTERCKCQSCRNTEHDRHNKFKDKFSTTIGGLAQLAAAAAADARAHSGSPSSDFDGGSDDVVASGGDQARMAAAAAAYKQQQHFDPKTQPWFYMTEDVIEATTMCLVSQAQELEQNLDEVELEKSVLREFGRCLEQIIGSATSSLPSSSSYFGSTRWPPPQNENVVENQQKH